MRRRESDINTAILMPLRLNTPPLAVGMKGGGTPTVAPKERSGVGSGGMKPLESMIPRLKRSGGRGGFISGSGTTAEAVIRAYLAYGAIGEQGVHFEGMHYRKDIGHGH